jgi:hypothetical protein
MNPFWVESDNSARLAIVARPRGGDWLEDEVRRMKLAGVDVLVSMLPADEAIELGLAGEPQLCETAGLYSGHSHAPGPTADSLSA